jgi:hypothetical protein
MKNICQYPVLLLIGVFILNYEILSQSISNVSFEVSGEDIHISYTLTPSSTDDFEISILLKRINDGSFNYLPQSLSGDIGEGQFSGINRVIIWEVSETEMSMLDGDDFYFEVFANKLKKSEGIPWYYFVGTAAVGGAVAAAVLLGGKDETSSPTTQNFPLPPDRP